MKYPFSILAVIAAFFFMMFPSCSDEQKPQQPPEPQSPKNAPVAETAPAETSVPAGEAPAPENAAALPAPIVPEQEKPQAALPADAPKTQIEALTLAISELSQVEDLASADKAAELVSALKADFEKFAAPAEGDSAEATQALGAIVALGQQLKRLQEENFFGSAALEKALTEN